MASDCLPHQVQEDTSSIVHDPSDGSYVIDGMADLDMVTDRLNLADQIGEELLNEFATLSGFLCHQAGEIPSEGFNVLVRRQDETAVRLHDCLPHQADCLVRRKDEAVVCFHDCLPHQADFLVRRKDETAVRFHDCLPHQADFLVRRKDEAVVYFTVLGGDECLHAVAHHGAPLAPLSPQVRFTVLGGDERMILSVKATNLTLARGEDGERTEMPSPFPPPPLQPASLDEPPLNTALAAAAPTSRP